MGYPDNRIFSAKPGTVVRHKKLSEEHKKMLRLFESHNFVWEKDPLTGQEILVAKPKNGDSAEC